jgi:putative PIN family toxin of toxin-antitoxin system
MLAVLDTNILVSAFWSRNGTPAKILRLVLDEKIRPCFNARIIYEYREVLLRPRFQFSAEEVAEVLKTIEEVGLSVVSPPLRIPFTDEADRKFYEVARFCEAVLITGNIKHFPKETGIVTPAEFLEIHSL